MEAILAQVYNRALPSATVKRLWFGGAQTLEALQRSIEEQPASLYGEILPAGVSALATRWNLGEGDVFADLGSGLARCVLQIFLEKCVAKAVGVEMDRDRHDAAVAAVNQFHLATDTSMEEEPEMCQWQSEDSRTLQLVCGDLLKVWRRWNGATAIFCSSLCFPEPVMTQLADQLDACTRLRYVASLATLPKYETFTLVAVERLPMTWQRHHGCPVYLYERLPCYPLGRSLLEEPWASIVRQESEKSAVMREVPAPFAVKAIAACLLLSVLPLALPKSCHSSAEKT